MLGQVEMIAELVLVAGAAVLAVPAAVLLLQVMVSCRVEVASGGGSPRPRVRVIVPAHNEEKCIAETLTSVKAQLGSGDQCLVVADNCDDATARIARECGALVVERREAKDRGKGFAIDYGRRHVESTGEFDVVVLIDADCQLGEGAIGTLSRRCVQTDRPVQAAYLMELPGAHQYAFGAMKMLAWRIKNYVRPLGGLALGFPCQLTGSGMAFPGWLFARTNFATADVVEDLKYGITLAIDGYPAVFCPQALVYSRFPIRADAMLSQRKRWEHGYLSSMLHYVPALIAQSLRQRSLCLLAMAADLAVPPLALFFLLNLTSLLGAFTFFLVTARFSPLLANVLPSATLLAAVLTIWLRHGRGVVSLGDLRRVPLYVLSKLPLYASFVTDRQTQWIRTDRDDLLA
jgi:cellulose synthase/poly-beta-1,6-N-acetylglucosamine synthase-like glycosyltransferase